MQVVMPRYCPVRLCTSREPIPGNQLPESAEQECQKETFDLLQKIRIIWAQRKLSTDHLVFSKITSKNKQLRWDIIPFSKEGNPQKNYAAVLWKLTFGSLFLSEKKQKKLVHEYTKSADIFSKPLSDLIKKPRNLQREPMPFARKKSSPINYYTKEKKLASSTIFRRYV